MSGPRQVLGRFFPLFVTIILFIAAYQACEYQFGNMARIDYISYDELAREIAVQNIKSITINNDSGMIAGEFNHPSPRNKMLFECQGNKNLIESLQEKLEESPNQKVKLQFTATSNLEIMFWGLLPVLIIIALVVFLIRRAGAGGGGASRAFDFGRSKAKLVTHDKNTGVTFRDVAGVDEAKEELKELVEFLMNPSNFYKVGGRIPKGVLLVGPSGTGKTLLARAVAGEANVPFFSVSGSEFVEMFVGVGAARVRDLFEDAKKKSPCIVFIDEIDAVGRKRSVSGGFGSGGHEEKEQTLNQLLTEMDGFSTNQGVIVIAATNRPDVLDSALLRPGRFDRKVMVDNPDIKGRVEILRIHARRIPLAENVDLGVIARGTPGFSGAELANLINEAALHAGKHKKNQVEASDLEWAKDRVMMGAERRSRVISPRQKHVFCYHEAGHTIVVTSLPEDETDPLHKVTIIGRGISGGSTWQLPTEDRGIESKGRLLNKLTILMGGRAAEEIGLNICSTGASHDFKVATDIARNMVCEWGMSPLGKARFDTTEVQKNYSEDTARKIDMEIKTLLDRAYSQAEEIIVRKIDGLKKIVQELMERETLTGEEVKQILNQKES